jgi:hypothetical protein
MASINGTIRIGEANAACATVGERQRGSSIIFYLVILAFPFGGLLLGLAVELLVKGNDWFAFAGVCIGLICYRLFGRKVVLWRFRRQTTSKGIPLDMPVCMTVSPDSLSYELADVAQRAKWTAVSELFWASGYWVFLVQVTPWYAPMRLFKDKDAERAFVREALSYMSDAARERSPDAVAFAQAGTT